MDARTNEKIRQRLLTDRRQDGEVELDLASFGGRPVLEDGVGATQHFLAVLG